MSNTNASRIPSYTKHAATGQARVRLNGRDIYLGKYGSKASKTAYERQVSEWLAAGRSVPHQGDLTVNELILAYITHVKGRVHPNRLQCIKYALAIAKELYGTTLACEFGPKALKACRQKMLEKDWSRGYVNRQVQTVKRAWKWACAEELIPGSVFHSLLAVEGIRRGEPGVRETAPVRPVPDAFVDAIRGYVSPTVWAMAQLQRLTGARPAEVCLMKGANLEMTGNVWAYKPDRHKTWHHGVERSIFLGPLAQSVIKPFLKTDLQAYLFSPAESELARSARRREKRATPLWLSHLEAQARKRKAKRQRPPSDHYTTLTYRVAIHRACARARVPSWSPNRLRHNSATFLRKTYGIEVAKAILGHRSLQTTLIYAEMDETMARKVMGEVG